MRILGVLFLALGLMMVSCSKEDQWSTIDSYVQGTYQEMSENSLGGHHRCYRANFPLTLLFPDGSSSDVEDREDLLLTLKAWKEANPDAEERPSFEFPFSVTRIGGEIIEVNSRAEIVALRRACNQFNNGHRRCGKFARFLNNKCFQVSLPLSLVLPDGDLIVLEDRQDIRRLLLNWKKDRPDEIPEISFPITVTIKESGEELVINSPEELDDLAERCKE